MISSYYGLVKKTYKYKGFWYIIQKGIHFFWRKLSNFFNYYLFLLDLKINSRNEFFEFNGRTYKYFFHPHNTTWQNERTVEVPIIYEKIKYYEGKRILEVGNVISKYYPFNGTVLDKYDFDPNVIHADVVDFRPDYKYDLIISISTLEHVGFDEEHIDPKKIIKSLENLRKCVKKEGEIIFTVPLGYNPHLDKYLNNKKLNLTETLFLERISNDNQWIETSLEKVATTEYNHPFPNANALLIGIIKL